MLKRAATVVWWIGAMCFAAGLLGMLRMGNLVEAAASVGVGAFFGAVFMSCAYILGGTFLKPPTGPLSE